VRERSKKSWIRPIFPLLGAVDEMLLPLSLFVIAVASSTISRGTPGNGWAGKRFQSLVTFRDSYTDEQRISYFANNNGTAPPVGWIEPVVCYLSLSDVTVGTSCRTTLYDLYFVKS
jgi:hypothetical protein